MRLPARATYAAAIVTFGGGVACEPSVVPAHSADATADARSARDSGAAGDAGLGPIDAPPADTACRVDETTSRVIRRPMDIVLTLDSDNSFNRPAAAISATLGASLLAQLVAEGVDYRIISMGRPLTAPAAALAPVLRWFTPRGGNFPANRRVCNLPAMLNVARPHLRPDSLIALIDFTDSGADAALGDRTCFDQNVAMFGLGPVIDSIGGARFRFHTVNPIAANVPPETPWPPTAPLVTRSSPAYPGVVSTPLQQLAIAAGGFRFALTEYTHYDGLFAAVAHQSLAVAQLPCEYGYPRTASGRRYDLAYARMTLRRADGTTSTYGPAGSEAECRGTAGFYHAPDTARDAGSTPADDRVLLCPVACAEARAAVGGSVRFVYECPPD